MYAAAGGASLASRQARQRQRQEKKTQQLQAKLHPPKASVLSVADHGASTPSRQSRQFHQLPTNYLRTPQAQTRKLSASYTTQSKLLLPIDEGDTQSMLHMRMHSHSHTHSHSHSHSHVQPPTAVAAATATGAATGGQHYHHANYVVGPAAAGRATPKLVHRHSGNSATSFHHSHLPKSATSMLPLVSQMEPTPPTTPSGVAVGLGVAGVTVKGREAAGAATIQQQQQQRQVPVLSDAMAVPHLDTIIVTPATPMASPGHVAKLRDDDDATATAAEKQPLTAAEPYDEDEPMEPPPGPLERKCSVYRMRRSDAFQHAEADADTANVAGAGAAAATGVKLQFNQQLKEQQYEPLLTDDPAQLIFKGLPNGRKWQVCAYCEEGICVCEHIECAQGRAAWLERGRRCSVQESQQQASCHRRWVKRNRIQDASLGGSSDDEDFLGVLRGPSTFANAFLYVGLGTIALGLVIAFVGTGEKGFKTVELRLIGPSLIGLGLICCILRILFCICPSHCISSSSKKTRKKNGNKVDADHTTSLLRGENKRVSIARGPAMQPKYPITHRRSQSKMINEGMEALRQIATTSLFMQNEQKPSMNRVVPIIKEPDTNKEAPLEMKKLETALNVCEVSDEEDEDDDNIRSHMTITIPAGANAPSYINGTITAAPTYTAAPPPLPTTTKATAATNHNGGSASGKHARQRVPLHHHHHQPQQQQQQQQHTKKSTSLLSSSTLKGDHADVEEEAQMETSLMVLKPAALSSEARPPPTTAADGVGVTLFSSTGATPRRLTTSATAPVVSALPPPPTYTSAISRTATFDEPSYDLPSRTPHTYASAAAAATAARSSNTERETLIRGPLGMPFAALTASSSAYALPAPPQRPALPAAPLLPSNPSTTITTISLLPLPPIPATPTITTAASSAATATTTATSTATASNYSNIPGQVMDSTPSTSSYATTTAATPSRLLLQQPKTSTATLAATGVTSFRFPAPLSSSSASASASASACSSASSNGRAPHPMGSAVSSLSPPPAASKFEPELLLSPAKLGQ